MLISSVVYCGSVPGLSKQTKISICWFSAKQAAFVRKSKDGSAKI